MALLLVLVLVLVSQLLEPPRPAPAAGCRARWGCALRAGGKPQVGVAVVCMQEIERRGTCSALVRQRVVRWRLRRGHCSRCHPGECPRRCCQTVARRQGLVHRLHRQRHCRPRHAAARQGRGWPKRASVWARLAASWCRVAPRLESACPEPTDPHRRTGKWGAGGRDVHRCLHTGR